MRNVSDDEERLADIARLRQQLSDAEAEHARLLEEVVHLAAHIHDIRAAFGNPFYYSHPEEPDEGVSNYTGGRSHAVGMPTFLAFRRVERAIARLKARLQELDAPSR